MGMAPRLPRDESARSAELVAAPSVPKSICYSRRMSTVQRIRRRPSHYLRTNNHMSVEKKYPHRAEIKQKLKVLATAKLT